MHYQEMDDVAIPVKPGSVRLLDRLRLFMRSRQMAWATEETYGNTDLFGRSVHFGETVADNRTSRYMMWSSMKQISFSEAEFAAKRKVTRRERVLSELDASVPWAALATMIEPHYRKGAGPGRPPVGLERMLRMYAAQQVLGLSDEGIEDAIYDSQSVRGFVGIDLATESAPDATTLLKFRRLLESAGLTRELFKTINQRLADKGLFLRNGTIVDATLIRIIRGNVREPDQLIGDLYALATCNEIGQRISVAVAVARTVVEFLPLSHHAHVTVVCQY